MIKKLFDWTPRDIAYWEKVHQKGLKKFIGWYGLFISGGLLFLVFGLVTVFIWIRQISDKQITPMNFLFLLGQLIIVALVCLAGGLINSLITWLVEDKLYLKYKAKKLSEN